MCRSATFIAVLALACTAPLKAQQREQGKEAPDEKGGLQFSGYYKNLLVDSTTVFAGSQPYTLDLNRFRLEWKGPVSPGVGVELQYDNEFLLGDYFRTGQAQLEEQLPPRTYWDWESTYARGDHYRARHRIHRGSVTLSQGATDVHIGRQRIAWGTGRFFSPLDVLNPFSPTTLEPGEREGVDAILIERKRSAVSRVSFAYAPVRDSARPNALAQWHDNVKGIDYSITAGQHAGGPFLGLDLAGQLGGAGLRAEWTVSKPEARQQYQRLLLGWDYAFPNTLTLSAELFYDGSGSSDPSRYDVAGFLAGRTQTLARRYAGGYASYELTPLLKLANWLVANLDDNSLYFSPRLTWSVRTNLDLSLGAQLFDGRDRSELGSRHNLYFTQLQWFF